MELLKYLNQYMNKNKSKYVIKPKRGRFNDIPEKLEPFELFYVTDTRMIGVADKDGNPQLLVNTIHYDYIDDFPEDPERDKLYYARIEGQLYFYDLNENKYNTVKLNNRNISL